MPFFQFTLNQDTLTGAFWVEWAANRHERQRAGQFFIFDL
jgi:hypothetical protein